MSVIVLDINNEEHARFLEKGSKDPLTKEQFKAGDSVVVDQTSNLVYHKDTWDELELNNATLEYLPNFDNIEIVPTPRIGNFNVFPSTITRGENVMLSWSVLKAKGVHIEPIGSFDAVNDSYETTPTLDTVYRLTAINKHKEAVAVASVTVQVPRIGLQPGFIDFGTIVNSASPPNKTVNVTNTGNGNLQWQVSEAPPWLMHSKTGNRLTLTCLPDNEGELKGEITFETNAVPVTLQVIAHVIPDLVTGFRIRRVGYQAELSWQKSDAKSLFLNKKRINLTSPHFVPYTHGKELVLEFAGSKKSRQIKREVLDVPVPRLKLQSVLKAITPLVGKIRALSLLVLLAPITTRLLTPVTLAQPVGLEQYNQLLNKISSMQMVRPLLWLVPALNNFSSLRSITAKLKAI